MVEHPFEDEAARLFATGPDLGDQGAFLAGVERRLSRYVRVRGYVVGAAAAIGAALAIRAIAGSSLVANVVSWSQSLGVQTAAFSESTAQANPQVWMWLTLVLCASGLAAASFVRRI
jgi:hypothetical protein